MVKVKERVMVDTIKQGTMDLVTDRSKSKLLSIVTSLVFPIILLNLGTTYIVEYVPDQVGTKPQAAPCAGIPHPRPDSAALDALFPPQACRMRVWLNVSCWVRRRESQEH
jgi:hypothetical protein